MLELNTDSPLFEMALAFHGHKCPAMPLGLRAGAAAMEKLGVEKAKNKELLTLCETGGKHPMSCFADGVMAVTGCTYGKGNFKKNYRDKLAFTLIEAASGRAVRVVVKAPFIEKSLNGPFVSLRRKGMQPQDIDAEIVDPLIHGILTKPEAELLDVGEVFDMELPKPKPSFKAIPCAKCGEEVFVHGARVAPDGEIVCIPCSGYEE